MSTFAIIIATHQRALSLRKCLETIAKQSYKSLSITISHSGDSDGTQEVINDFRGDMDIRYIISPIIGAASQRNAALSVVEGDWIFFLDDDVELDNNFFTEISNAIKQRPDAGGVSGKISNQSSLRLSFFSRSLLWLAGGGFSNDVNGKIRGPIINFLPYKMGKDLEEIEWMPTCVCGYRKTILAEAGEFPGFFRNYSLGEDIYISMKVKKKYPLILARKAVLFHNYLGGLNSDQAYSIGFMQIYNRMFILKEINNRASLLAMIRLMFWNTSNAILNYLTGHRRFNILWNSLCGYVKGGLKSFEFL